MNLSKKILGWALIVCSLTVFFVVLIYLIVNPLVIPTWLPIAFIFAVIPLIMGFYYVYSDRNKSGQKTH